MKNGALAVWFLVYVVAVVFANYTATWFIQLPVFGLLSVGTIIFGITFTARDYVHRAGRRYVYSMIATAAVASLLMAVATDTPLRILLASFFTILVSETVDTEVYQRFIKRPWLARVSISNGVSVPVDSVMFTLLAFAGTMTLYQMLQIVFADVLVKYASGFVAALLRYVGVREFRGSSAQNS